MSFDFQTTTHGKWILAGEHAVLRGHSALVFPLKQKSLTLTYCSQAPKTIAEFTGECGADAHLLFWSVLEQGMEELNLSLTDLSGQFHIHNTIPIGAGLGASGALCAAVARWFAWKKFIDEQNVFEFACRLENLFHGKSSGIDILGALTDDGLVFTKELVPQKINCAWQPHWYLSFSGELGITAHCVKKVTKLWEDDATLAASIDKNMKQSVTIAQIALSNSSTEGLLQLTEAMQIANTCFHAWGLVSSGLENHLNLLLQHGALAVKPTGSGAGGYAISLWAKPPQKIAGVELLNIN